MHLSPDEMISCCPPLPPWGLESPDGPLPLTGVGLDGTVTGLNAVLGLTQTYRNDRDHPIEVVYTFPLPDRFAVAGMTAKLGDREVIGRIDERGGARNAYEDALQHGNRAVLVEQERGNVFTAQLGNLAPGETATITLQLAGQLAVDSGEATLRVPLLVGERYNPGTPTATDPAGTGIWPDTDQVPDASRISPPRRPGPTGVDLHLIVDVFPAGMLTGTPRATPTLHVEEHGDQWMVVAGSDSDLVADLVVRFGVRQPETRATAQFAADQGDPTEGTWQVVVSPPEPATASPRTVVLALDRSGSMHGWKMVAARRTAARIVDSLGADDRFCVLGFDHELQTVPGQEHPIPATDRNRYAAVRWLSGLEARGGTELAAPLAYAATDLAGIGGDCVLVLLTDGQVGNEAALLRLMSERLHGVRVYALGVDHAVNATFLRRLAAVGGGRCDLVESEDELDRVLQQLHRRIAPPVARAVAVAVEGVRIDRAYTIPDLADVFPAGPTVVTGRWRGNFDPAAISVTVMAETDSGVVEWSAPVTDTTDQVDVLRNTWARAQVERLQDDLDAWRPGMTREVIIEFSLAHQVLSPYTAWLAIGPGGVIGPLETVVQPVAEHLHRGTPVPSMSAMPTLAPPDLEDLEVPDFLREAPTRLGRRRLPSEPAKARGKHARRIGDGGWFGLFEERAAWPAEEPRIHAMTPAPDQLPDLGLADVDLSPFSERVRAILARFATGGDPALARELAELISDLESVEAPTELIEALAGLPESASEVERLWEALTEAPLE